MVDKYTKAVLTVIAALLVSPRNTANSEGTVR